MKGKLKRIFNTVGLDVKRHTKQYPLLHFLLKYNIHTAIDVGANVGQFSKLIREALPDTPIYAFEPIRECYDALQKTFANDKFYTSYKIALGSHVSEEKMFKNDYLPSSSLLANTHTNNTLFPHTRQVLQETVQMTCLDELNIPLEKNVLLKLDVQGYEMEVLKGGMKTLQESLIIITEVSFVELYKKQPLFNDLYQFLHSQGFSYYGSIQTKREDGIGIPLFEDAIFVRR